MRRLLALLGRPMPDVVEEREPARHLFVPPPKPLVPAYAWLRLVDAAVCADCDAVFHVELQRCPGCGSRSFLPLSIFVTPRGRRRRLLRRVGR